MHCTGFIPSYDTSRIGYYHMSTHVHDMNVKRSDKVTLQCDDLSRVLLACVLVGVLGYKVLQFQIYFVIALKLAAFAVCLFGLYSSVSLSFIFIVFDLLVVLR